MRRKIFDTIEVAAEGNRVSAVYDCTMMAAILASLIPLAFKSSNPVFETINHVTGVLFVIDYAGFPL